MLKIFCASKKKKKRVTLINPPVWKFKNQKSLSYMQCLVKMRCLILRTVFLGSNDLKRFLHSELYYDADVLIVGLVSDDGILKGGKRLEEAPFRDDMFTIEEIMELKRKYRIKRIIVTHIDEYWGKSYADYLKIERTLDNISFAYDGMEIIL